MFIPAMLALSVCAVLVHDPMAASLALASALFAVLTRRESLLSLARFRL